MFSRTWLFIIILFFRTSDANVVVTWAAPGTCWCFLQIYLLVIWWDVLLYWVLIMKTGWKIWDCLFWAKECSSKTLYHLPVTEGSCTKVREGLLTRACSDKTRENGFKLSEGRLRSHYRKKLFTVGTMGCWNSSPRELWMPHPRKCFKTSLSGALTNLVQWKLSLHMAEGWNEVFCKVPSDPNHSLVLFSMTQRIKNFHNTKLRTDFFLVFSRTVSYPFCKATRAYKYLFVLYYFISWICHDSTSQLLMGYVSWTCLKRSWRT